MSATLSYDLKKYLRVLSQDGRWDVLTVLILHSNIRNRCFVGMDTIADLATGGNKTKATRAKKWLLAHSAYELVPFAKRVGEELKLAPRQHIYQLTGSLRKCADKSCSCQEWDVLEFLYLHHGALDVPPVENIEVLNGQNIREGTILPNVLDGQNIEILPIENIEPTIPPEILPNVLTIENGSIKDKDKERDTLSPQLAFAVDEAADKAYQPVDTDTAAMMQADVYIRVYEGACKARGAPQKVSRTKANKRIAAQWYIDGYKDDEIRRAVDLQFEEGKPVIFAFLQERMANNRVARARQGIVLDDGGVPDEWDVTSFMRTPGKAVNS